MKRELVYRVRYYAPSVEDGKNSALKLAELPDPVSDKKEILFAGEIPMSEIRRKYENRR